MYLLFVELAYARINNGKRNISAPSMGYTNFSTILCMV